MAAQPGTVSPPARRWPEPPRHPPEVDNCRGRGLSCDRASHRVVQRIPAWPPRGLRADRRLDCHLEPGVPRMIVTNRDVTANARLDGRRWRRSLTPAMVPPLLRLGEAALEILCRATGAGFRARGLTGRSSDRDHRREPRDDSSHGGPSAVRRPTTRSPPPNLREQRRRVGATAPGGPRRPDRGRGPTRRRCPGTVMRADRRPRARLEAAHSGKGVMLQTPSAGARTRPDCVVEHGLGAACRDRRRGRRRLI